MDALPVVLYLPSMEPRLVSRGNGADHVERGIRLALQWSRGS